MSTVLALVAAALLAWPAQRSAVRLQALRLAAHTAVPRGRADLGWVLVGGCAVIAVVGAWTVGCAAAIVVSTLLFRRHRAAAERARHEQQRQLGDGLDNLIAELRVGAHPAAACAAAAQESDGVAAEVFAIAAARGRLGGVGADALCDSASRISEELVRVARAWRLAEAHGLALAELLGACREDLLGRIRFRGRTQAALAGARATAAVLAGLPLLGVLLGELMGAHPLAVLLGGGVGGILLLVGCALACAGLLWSDTLTRQAIA